MAPTVALTAWIPVYRHDINECPFFLLLIKQALLRCHPRSLLSLGDAELNLTGTSR